MTSKHPRPDEQPAKGEDDLERNPALGQSKGLFGRNRGSDADLIEGDNTVEGDTENDAGVAGGVDPTLGRTNE